ncbi:MAG: helix-hairpin-helix domain-containing protein [Oscillospiraceae bacterium]|nr:helix-hairpin-helix domain-containing protein [Oscillospiraceae bacterium]
MERQEKFGKAHVTLLALTLAFLGSLAFFAAHGGSAAPADDYTVAVERSVPAEELAPEKQPVDVNAATAEELQQLMGIGPVLAQAIVDYREEHGPFESIDELLEVSGIGETKLGNIRDDITLGEEDAA